MPKSKLLLYGLYDFVYLQHPSPELNQKLKTELEKTQFIFDFNTETKKTPKERSLTKKPLRVPHCHKYNYLSDHEVNAAVVWIYTEQFLRQC